MFVSRGLSERYCYNLLGWLLGPGYVLENYLLIHDHYSVADDSEDELSSIKDESETEDPTYEPLIRPVDEESLSLAGSGYVSDSPGDQDDDDDDEIFSETETMKDVTNANHQSEDIVDDKNSSEILLKRKYDEETDDDADDEVDKKLKLEDDDYFTEYSSTLPEDGDKMMKISVSCLEYNSNFDNIISDDILRSDHTLNDLNDEQQ